MKITELMTVAEFAVAIVVIVFLVLAAFIIVTGIKIRKSIELAQRDFRRLSLELSSLISKATEVTSDIQEKTHLLFDSLSSSNESQPTSQETAHQYKMPFKLIGWVVSSFLLARKTKNFLKKLW